MSSESSSGNQIDSGAMLEEPESSTVRVDFIGKLVEGRFLIEKLIGQGGNGSVFIATDIKDARKVAIKIANDDNPNTVKRFNRETRTARLLKHRNIVDVFHYGVESGYPYFVMEFIDGKRLSDLIAEHPIPLSRIIHIFKQICEALSYAHNQGIVHRDLKPSNVMLSGNDDTVKLLDFGVATQGEWDVGDDSVITRSGEIIGTPLYISPEQSKGKRVDQRSDIYSLGCLLYECLVGKPPYMGTISVEILAQHENAEAVAPSEAFTSGNYPKVIDLIVLKMLAKKPINRYQTAADVLSDLQAFENGTLKASQIVLFERKKDEAAVEIQTTEAVKPGGRLLKDWRPFACLCGLILAALIIFQINNTLNPSTYKARGMVYYHDRGDEGKPGSLFLLANGDGESAVKLLEFVVPEERRNLFSTATGAGDIYEVTYHKKDGCNIVDNAFWLYQQSSSEDIKALKSTIHDMFSTLAKEEPKLAAKEVAKFYTPIWSKNDCRRLADIWSKMSFKNPKDIAKLPPGDLRIESYSPATRTSSILIRTNYWISSGPEYLRFVMLKDKAGRWQISNVELITESDWLSANHTE